MFELGKGDETIKLRQKHVIGYIDREGSLPFKIVEYVFFSHKDLWENASLIQLSPANPVPAGNRNRPHQLWRC